MNVKVRGVRNAGQLKDERLVLDVLRDDDIGFYFVFDSTFTADGKVSNLVRHPFWFPDKTVKAKDTVVLYTKNGTTSTKQNKDGTTSHFFYWGLDKTVWNMEGDCAIVTRVDDWVAHKAV